MIFPFMKDGMTSRRSNIKLLLLIAIGVVAAYVLLQIFWIRSVRKADDIQVQREMSECLSYAAKACAKADFLKWFKNNEDNSYIIISIKQISDTTVVRTDYAEYNDIGSKIEVDHLLKAIEKDPWFLKNLADSILHYRRKPDIKSLYLTVTADSGKYRLPHYRRTLAYGSLLDKPANARFDVKGKGFSYHILMSAMIAAPPDYMLLITLTFFSLIVLLLLIVAFIILITNLERQEKDLESNEHYFFGLVHDLKTPLAYTYSVLDELSENVVDPVAQNKIREAGDHVSELSNKVQQILTVPRIISSKEHRYSKLFPEDLFSEIEAEMRRSYPRTAVEFVYDFPEDVSFFVPKIEVEMIVRVLMDNAVRYSGTDPRIILRCSDSLIGRTIQFSVSDNCPGLDIPKTHLVISDSDKYLYSLNKKSKGNGVGLITACRIAESFGGWIIYDKLDGGGSNFTLLIPKAE